MGGYSEQIGFGGARGRTIDMTDEEIYRKLRREYPTASTAALYTMMDEVKRSQVPTKVTYSIPEISEPDKSEFGFTGFTPSQQQTTNTPQLGLSNQSSTITYEKLQNTYNDWVNAGINQAWNGNTYPTYGTQPRYYTASQEYFPPPPMSPEPQKPAKKKAQAEIVVTGKRSIILDEDI